MFLVVHIVKSRRDMALQDGFVTGIIQAVMTAYIETTRNLLSLKESVSENLSRHILGRNLLKSLGGAIYEWSRFI